MIADAEDILYGRSECSNQDQGVSIQDIISDGSKKKKSGKAGESVKRPEGMHRELYNLLMNDKTPKDPDALLPLQPTLTPQRLGGYQDGLENPKARLGLRRARSWGLRPFLNPARPDALQLEHWKREDQLGDPYPFARFNKALNCPTYSNEEYDALLTSPHWTKEETDHLLDLANRFDLRWLIIHDRWEKERFRKRSVEDLKERFYDLWNTLIKDYKAKTPGDEEPVVFKFDAEHERRRKEQLEKLWNRTEAEVEEEERLIAEVRKIEARQKERERKAMDLQKLITAADRAPPAPSPTSATPGTPGAQAALKKKLPKTPGRLSGGPALGEGSAPSSTGLKFQDIKTPGTHIRSQKMKLPQQIGQKKLKAVETAVAALGLVPPPISQGRPGKTRVLEEAMPMGTEEIAREFNGLREDIVLLWELKSALASCEFELEAKRQHLLSATGVDIPIPPHLRVSAPEDGPGPVTKRRLTDAIQLSTPSFPLRRRKTAIEQTAMLRRLRKS